MYFTNYFGNSGDLGIYLINWVDLLKRANWENVQVAKEEEEERNENFFDEIFLRYERKKYAWMGGIKLLEYDLIRR